MAASGSTGAGGDSFAGSDGAGVQVKIRNTFIEVDEGTKTTRRRGYHTLPVDFGEVAADGSPQEEANPFPEAELPTLLGTGMSPAAAERDGYPIDRKVRFQGKNPGSAASTDGGQVKVKNTFIEFEDSEDLGITYQNRRRGFRTCPDIGGAFQGDCAVEQEALHGGHYPAEAADRNVGFSQGRQEQPIADHLPQRGWTRSDRRRLCGTEDLQEQLLGDGGVPWKAEDMRAESPEHEVGVQHWRRNSVELERPQFQSRAERQMFYTTEDFFEPLKVPGLLPSVSPLRGSSTARDGSMLYSPNAGNGDQQLYATTPSFQDGGAVRTNVGITATEPAPSPPPYPAPEGLTWPYLPRGMQPQSQYPLMMLAPWATNSVPTTPAPTQADVPFPGSLMIPPNAGPPLAAQQTPQPMFSFQNNMAHRPQPSGPVAGNIHLPQQPEPSQSMRPVAVSPSAPSAPTSPTARVLSPTSAGSEPNFGTAGTNETAPGNGEPGRASNKRPLRLWAHIYLHMLVPGFDLVPMLIGRRGANMRKIADATNAKVRVRGRGSGHLEINGTSEAPTPLMVAVTSDKKDAHGFKLAVEMTVAQLQLVERRFRIFCEKEGRAVEGPCFSVGLLTEGAEEMLGRALDGVPFGHIARGGNLVLGRGNNGNGNQAGRRL